MCGSVGVVHSISEWLIAKHSSCIERLAKITRRDISSRKHHSSGCQSPRAKYALTIGGPSGYAE